MDNRHFTTTLEQRLGDPRAAVLLETFASLIREQTMQTGRIALPGFGSFEGVKHDEEVVTDLTSGKRMLLPPSIEVRFTPGAMLRKKMKEGKK